MLPPRTDGSSFLFDVARLNGSVQRLDNVDRTHLVLDCSNLALQKNRFVGILFVMVAFYAAVPAVFVAVFFQCLLKYFFKVWASNEAGGGFSL